MCVLYSGVTSEATRGRHHMRRVSGDEDALRLKFVGHFRSGVPVHHVVDFDGHVVAAECDSHEFEGALGGEIRRHIGDRLCRVAHRVDDQEGALERFLETEKPAQPIVVDVYDRPLLVVQSGAHGRTKVDRDALRERRMPAHRDAELLPHATVGAVGGDEILRPYSRDFACVAVPNGRRYAVAMLFHRGHFGGKPNVGSQLECALF